MLSYLSAILHGPVSLACTCSAGVSAQARTLGRLLDVIAIHTCGGVHRPMLHHDRPASNQTLCSGSDCPAPIPATPRMLACLIRNCYLGVTVCQLGDDRLAVSAMLTVYFACMIRAFMGACKDQNHPS